MAKAKPVKEKGEWKTKVLTEVADGTSTWKAQRLTAPDGKVMVGIRKFVTKKDGSEQITQHGLTFPVEGGKDQIKMVVSMLRAIYAKAK